MKDSVTIPSLVLGPGGEILDVPENQEFLKQLEAAPNLKPQELLSIASKYLRMPSMHSLGEYLACAAIAQLTSDPKINEAIEKISDHEVGFSIFGDIWDALTDAWDAVKEFFSGGTDQKDPEKCEFKCLVGMYLEKCGSNDVWHVIGLCIGFGW